MTDASNFEKSGWNFLWQNDFLNLFHHDKLNMGICVVTKEYIPIAEFKSAFLKASEFAKEKDWKGFVFDKTALTTFHQPSMEWYYTSWKQSLLEYGLKKHYKILPPAPWFKTSVDAGIDEIKSNHPSFDFSQIEVTYINSIEELEHS